MIYITNNDTFVSDGTILLETLIVLPFRVSVDLGVIAMKGFITLPKTPRIEPHHQTLG